MAWNSSFDDVFRHMQGGMMRVGPGAFTEMFRAYSVAMKEGNERTDVNFGGKILLPPSALDKLSRLHIEYPMQFQLSNASSDRVTHAGVLEFIAEEGRVYLPNWMMNTLLLEQGDFVQIKNASLPLGSWVKIQPQSVDFLDIHDPRAVLETALRSYSTLTPGDVISLMYNKRPYDIEVLEVRPSSAPKSAISIVETDVEVDFAPPVGYQEPKQQMRPASVMSAAGSHMSIEEHKHERMVNQFQSFSGSGVKLSGKPSATTGESSAGTPQTSNEQDGKPKPPAALRLPHGKLYFGYPIVPPKKPSDGTTPATESSSETTAPAFSGTGQTLRARKGPRSSPAPQSAPQQPSFKGKEKAVDAGPVPVPSVNNAKDEGKDKGQDPFAGKGYSLR